MNYILFDDHTWENLLPLTFTRPVAGIRVGILTIEEKWNMFLKSHCSFFTREYLREKYLPVIQDENILINSSIFPNQQLVEGINSLKIGQTLVKDDVLIAVSMDRDGVLSFDFQDVLKNGSHVEFKYQIQKINHPWDIFSKNGEAFLNDYTAITSGRNSCNASSTNNIIKGENVFIEENVKMEYVTINASTGPVYLGKNSEVMEGSIIRGSFALCDHSVVKIGAKIYGPTTIGPHSKVGGEINNSVIFGYSNKAHDGFLGNSVIGEWCNIGADTNNSNLKNNYAEVKLWSYQQEQFIKTGLQFCGLIMGDHSKCGINTMFNTGTMVGVNANIYGGGFPRNFIPSFSWGGANGFVTFSLPKAFEVAEKIMARRNIPFNNIEQNILKAVFNMTAKYRK